MSADDRSPRPEPSGNGSIRHHITGPARQGEEGVLRVARLLVRRLNADGGHWAEPLDVSADRAAEGVDCTASNGRSVLRMQVTRADGDQHLWQRVGQHGEAEKHTDHEEAVEVLRASIERKAARLPEGSRADLVLVLDATDMPGLVAAPAELFARRLGGWAAGLGFQAIWVVGPEAGLVARLDGAAPRDGDGGR